MLRLSGPEAIAIADRMFRGRRPLMESSSHTLNVGTLEAEGGTLDRVVAALFRAPRSYTGEDVVEFSCHGGPWILRRALELSLSRGARTAEPGEFSRRAYANGKLDLSQAEAVAEVIAARSQAQHRMALERLGGGLARRLRPWRAELLDLLARLEAGLDFAEDEPPALERAELGRRLEEMVRGMGAVLDANAGARAWRDGVRVALAGRPNAGKSSLFNALLDQDRAIVAETPGTTRDLLEESAVWDGLPVVLSDTAGFRSGAERAEALGVERAARAVGSADAVLLLVPSGEMPSDEDRRALEAARERPIVLVLSKADLQEDDPARWRRALGLPEAPAVSVSARTGAGLESLRRSVLSLLETGAEPPVSETALNARQEARLRAAREALLRASGVAPEEALSGDLRAALADLNAITGEGAPDEVLDAIFSRFCVGK